LAVTLVAGAVFGHSFFHVSVVTLDRLALAGLMVWAAALLCLGRLAVPSLHRMDILVGCFYAWMGFNLLTSDWRFRDSQPVSMFLFFYILPLALYAVVRLIGHEQRTWRVLQTTLIGLGAYLAFTAFCEARDLPMLVFPKSILNPDEPEFLGRGRGPFLNPVSNGVFLIVCLAGGLALWPTTAWRQRGWIVAFGLLLALGIWATLTRSNWMAAASLLALFAWRHSTWPVRGLATIALPCVLLVGIGLFGDKINAFKRDKHVSVEDMSESAELRPYLATIAGKMIQERPITGYGLAQYPKHAKPYHFRNVTDKPLQKVMQYVQHNTFLAYAVELGIGGLLSFLLLLGVAAWSSLYLWLDPRLPARLQGVGFVVFAGIWAYTVNGLFHDVAITVMSNHLLYLLIGLLAAVSTHAYPTMRLTTGATAQKS
jgi:O-antigen ligase